MYRIACDKVIDNLSWKFLPLEKQFLAVTYILDRGETLFETGFFI